MSNQLLERKLNHAFSQMDLDGNGFIEKDDVVALGMNTVTHFGIDPVSERGQAVHRAFHLIWEALEANFDTDQDGRISPDEYRSGFVASFAGRSKYDSFFQPAVDSIVSLGGAAGAGTMTVGEWRKLQFAYGTGAEEADEVFRLLDSDGSSVLTRDEITRSGDRVLHRHRPRRGGQQPLRPPHLTHPTSDTRPNRSEGPLHRVEPSQ